MIVKNNITKDWLNLSFNKIYIYKDLYDEFKKNFIWIDLDTIITYNISYINDLNNCFIENGGTCNFPNKLFTNNNLITVPRNRYIQGNFWKLNIELYYQLMKTLDELKNKKLYLRYDLQDLFSYYIFIKKNGDLSNINIIGYNVKINSLNGLSIWSKNGNSHANICGLNNLYYYNNTLRTKYYPTKEIHILSFTFKTLKILWDNDKFNQLFTKNNKPILIENFLNTNMYKFKKLILIFFITLFLIFLYYTMKRKNKIN